MEHSSAAAVCEGKPIDSNNRQGIAGVRPIQVLLVEDDHDAAQLVSASLFEDKSEPFYVEWSQTLVAAMNRLEFPGIDVILLDLGLPELTGYRSYRAIEAASDHHVPVVIHTADDRPNIRQVILEFGASDYLVKGHNSPAQLRQALRAAVWRGWPRPALRSGN